jgi:hypothetical protein
LRYDGSSRFRGDERWGLFPSVSLGWNIAREKFFEDYTDIFGTLKLRASYGELGNQNTSNYYRFGIDYQMSEKTTIGLSTDGNLAGSKVEGDMNSSIPKRSPQTGGLLRTLNDQNRSRDNFTAVLSLTHT